MVIRDNNEKAGSKRAERKSRSVLLHGYGGAMLRVFGTYQLDDNGQPEKIVVRAYHAAGKGADGKIEWNPSDPTVAGSLDELEDEIADWETRATAIGYRRATRRGAPGAFSKDSIPAPPKQLKPGTFTKGGIPDPLPVRQGGSRGRR